MTNRILSTLAALALLSFAAPEAQASTHAFQPEAGQAARCQKLGMVGNFKFLIDAKHPQIAEMTFTRTKQKIAVLRSGPGVWRIVIQGGWSEFITLDFNEGSFSYQSSRPGRAGSCEARVR